MRRRQDGVTFLDLLLVVVIVAVIATYGIMRLNTTAENTLWYQAHRLARDIRHAQVLAATYGRPLALTADTASASYSVACVTTGATPCDVSPIIDPVTGNSFAFALQNGVTLGVSGTNPVRFDMLGRPLDSGGAVITATNPSTTFTLSAGTTVSTVTVAAITGFVAVTP